jgi:hypothetical protein
VCVCVRGHKIWAFTGGVVFARARAPLGDDDVRVVTYKGFVLLGSIYLHWMMLPCLGLVSNERLLDLAELGGRVQNVI